MNDRASSVDVVGAPWKESPYYADAERWTHLFWADHTVFRQMFNALDMRSALELACGHGRHAQKAAGLAGRLVLMDIHEGNLEACRQRLRSYGHIGYVLNNGYDFQPVEDGALTAIFCYDAMVHFSPDLVASYLEDAARVLAPGGRALFHHSNYPAPLDRHYGQNPHARNHMTRDLFASLSRDAGLRVAEATVIPWGEDRDLDCVSLVEKP